MPDLGSRPYHEAFDSLRGIYLEDSFVLAVELGGDRVTFDLEAVLTPEHPDYGPPKDGEHYCYQLCKLVVTGIVKFEPSGQRPFFDATGEEDFGNIDSFRESEGDGNWRADGHWGVLEAHQPDVTVTLVQ